MDRLNGAADKLFEEMEHLDRIIDRVNADPSEDTVALALSISKRVRRQSNLVVRALARLRDQQLQPKEAQAHDRHTG